MIKSFAIVLGILLVFTVALAQSPDPPPPSSDDYRIGIEDSLQILVWEEPEMNRTVRVRPDGKITFPLVNDFTVAGLTPSEVRQEIVSRLSKYVREPNVTVIVTEMNSFKVYILGEVNLQGVFTFYRATRLLDAIAHAGGFQEFSKKQITVLREKYGVETRLNINYKSILAGDPSHRNIYLVPGDTLIVK